MGATTFSVYTEAPDAQAAFNSLVSAARLADGRSGYTGTIAEKHEFVHMGTAKNTMRATMMADKFLKIRDPRIDDKWGPAGCITVKDGDRPRRYYFFGWASE